MVAVIGVAFVFYLFSPQKHSEAAKGLSHQTRSQDDGVPNYDIRADKRAVEKISSLRSAAGKNAFEIADRRDSMVRAERSLKARIPNLKVEYNAEQQTPEIIATDVSKGKSFLTNSSHGKRWATLKTFLEQNSELVGSGRSNIDKLKVSAEYTNPDGELSFVELDQEINGVPVFRGQVKAGFTKAGELIRVINNLAADVDEYSTSTDFGDPLTAVNIAARAINNDGSKIDRKKNGKASTDRKVVFGEGDLATTAEKMYFPTEPGVVVPAWRTLIWQPTNAFYVIVDAKSGTVLWRKNITDDQSQPATYNVYASPNAMVNIAHSPFPFSPGPIGPNGTQGAALARTSITRIGNEAPYTFNNQGWLPDGAIKTDGNNVQAGLDRDGTDGIDLNSEAVSATRDFTFNYSPLNPNDNTGENPIPLVQTYPGSQFQQGIVTQLFYITNWYHDETYRLGFTEAAGNFQNTNFTGLGIGGDRIRAEGQDSAGTNNANFSTPADGGRGRMQMFIFTAPNPDIDGSLDADVVIHELTHGLSNRLHGNGSGLFNDMSRGMGEGWSDFYGMAMLSQPNDPIDGLNTTGAYVTYLSGGSTNNAYYGIRRFPTAIMSSVGGPNNRPHNPLTFADIDSTQLNISDGAFNSRTNGTADQVHNAGEIWCNMLWEIRARMIQRLGWAVGNRRVLQLVTDGMKLAPLSPTFISERDAIVAAAFAGGDPDDVADVWAGFATRGLGSGATIQNVGGTSTGGTGAARVTEAFDLPNISQSPFFTISDAIGDDDGFPEPGETVTFSIPLTNSTGKTATDVSLQIVGGGSANYGTMSGISNLMGSATYTIPSGANCGGTASVTFNVTSSLGPASFTGTFLVGKPDATTTSENFDGVTAPALPTGWTATSVSGGTNFVNSTTTPDTAPNAMFALDPTTVGGGTDLTSPFVSVTSAAATVSFKHNYATESGWDGGVLEISVAGAPFQDILTAGGSFTQNGYNGSLGAGANNPIANRAAWTGNSGGYITTTAQLPAVAIGKIVQLRWRFGADDNTAVTGWRVDTISLNGAGFVTTFACSVGAPRRVTVSGRVMTPTGLGLRNAIVILTDSQSNVLRATTSSFGVYQFQDIPNNEAFTLGVSSKRYRFAARQINLTGNLSNLDFIGLE